MTRTASQTKADARASLWAWAFFVFSTGFALVATALLMSGYGLA